MNIKPPKFSIIVPTYNEKRSISDLVKYIQQVQYPIDYEIIIVDDASMRNIEEDLRLLKEAPGQSQWKFLKNTINQGKGFSIREGIKKAEGNIIIVQDADCEYDPHDLPALLDPILRGETKVVYGSRFLNCHWPVGMSLASWLANRFLTFLTNVLFGLRLTDMETGYKVFASEVIRDLPLRENRFSFEPEVTALLAKRGISIKELPISYRARNRQEGKKIRPRDFFFAVGVLVGEYFCIFHRI